MVTNGIAELAGELTLFVVASEMNGLHEMPPALLVGRPTSRESTGRAGGFICRANCQLCGILGAGLFFPGGDS